MNYNSNTAADQKATQIPTASFDTMLDETCERLMDRQMKYSIERIYELERRLASLERELDEFMQNR